MRKATIESGIIVSGTHIGSLRWNERSETFAHLAMHALHTEKALVLCGNIWAHPDAILQGLYPAVYGVLRQLLQKGLLIYIPGSEDHWLGTFDFLFPAVVQRDGLLVHTGDITLHIESPRKYGDDPEVLRDVARRLHGSGDYDAVIFGGRLPEEEIIAAIDSRDRPSGHDGLYISVGSFLGKSPTFVRFDKDTCSLMRLTSQGGERFHGGHSDGVHRKNQGVEAAER